MSGFSFGGNLVRMVLTANLLRRGDGDGRVTNVELFFDLVYVFAVTQLSHHLLERPTVRLPVERRVLR